MTSLWRTLRRLRRAPAFSLPAAVTLCLGIGGSALAFTVVHGVLLKPLPYQQPDELVDLSHTLQISGTTRVDQSDATYLLYRRENRVFSDVGVYRSVAVNLRATADGAAQRATAAQASAGLFGALRVAPLLGRALVEADFAPGAPPVVLIGQRLWERAWGRDPQVVGQRVLVDGVEREVAGVMPARFGFPSAETSLWLPLAFDPARTSSAAFDYRGVARLKAGSTVASATADLQRLLPRVPEAFPGRLTAQAIEITRMQAEARPLRDVIVGDIGQSLWIAMAGVLVLLLVACANVTNLFLARAEGRQRELAVRRALGAGRGPLFAEQVSEALVLCGGAAVAALLVTAAVLQVLPASGLGAGLPRLAEVRLDWVVLLFTAGVAALAALCAAAAPLLRGGSASLAGLLGSSAPTSTGQARSRVRRGLVVAQVALALVLLSAAGLLARSFARLRAVDPGFAAAGAFTFRLAIPGASYATAGDVARLVMRAEDSLRALPGVVAAGVATRLPLDPAGRMDSAVFVESRPLEPGVMPGVHRITFVSPHYFRAMGIPLLAGRPFAALDPGVGPGELPRDVIVSAALARRYWGDGEALGQRIRMNPSPREPWSTVVGVVGNVRDAGLAEPPGEVVYVPLTVQSFFGPAWTPRDVAFVVRRAESAGIEAAVARAMQQLDNTLPPYRWQPLDGLLASATARTTITALLLAVAAFLALAIGAAGIYGVAAYLVTLRTREFGVRIALGAAPADVHRLVFRHVVTDAGLGIAIGLVAAALLSRVMPAVLYEVQPLDPPVLGLAALLLLLTALAAGILPARRAAGLDPTTAFRVE